MARKGFKPVNGFDKNPERARIAGRKSATGLTKDLREMRNMNATEFETCIYKYFHLNIESLKKIFSNPDTPARDLVVIKILTKAIEEGDYQRLNFLLERTIGKVTDRIQLSGRVESYKEIRVRMENLSEEEATQKYFEMLKVVS